MKTDLYNYYNFILEAENMPEKLWLTQFFDALNRYLIPIMAGMIEIEYDEDIAPIPTEKEFLESEDKELVKAITFSGCTNFWWLYSFHAVLETYKKAKFDFLQIKNVSRNLRRKEKKMFKEIKEYFEKH